MLCGSLALLVYYAVHSATTATVTAQSQHTAEWHSRLWSVAGGRNVVYFTGRVVRCHRLYCAGPVAAGGRCGQRVSRSQRSARSARRRHRCRTARGRVARGAMQRSYTKRSAGTAQQRWDGPTVRPVMRIGSHCGLLCCAHRPAGYAHTPIAHVNTLGPAASPSRTA